MRSILSYPIFLLLALGISSSVRADVMFLSGSFNDPNDVFEYQVNIASHSTINIQTFGYGGGTNAQGTVIAPGGFDPVISLFAGIGDTAELLDLNDDGTCPPGQFDTITGACLDSTLDRFIFSGFYTVALTSSANLPNGLLLAEGFTGGGSFVDVFGDLRTSNYAFQVTTTPINGSNVPEPNTFALVFVAVVLMLANRTMERLPT